MKEIRDSKPGNRCWSTRVPIEGVGSVRVSTCRPWFDRTRQRDYYETCLLWDSGSLVVHTYGDAHQAGVGHNLWCDGELIAGALVIDRRGEWVAAHTTGFGDWPATDLEKVAP